MNCNCINEVNEAIKADNSALDVSIVIDRKTGKVSQGLMVPCHKLDKASRLFKTKYIKPNFCPFCGKAAQ